MFRFVPSVLDIYLQQTALSPKSPINAYYSLPDLSSCQIKVANVFFNLSVYI